MRLTAKITPKMIKNTIALALLSTDREGYLKLSLSESMFVMLSTVLMMNPESRKEVPELLLISSGEHLEEKQTPR